MWQALFWERGGNSPCSFLPLILSNRRAMVEEENAGSQRMRSLYSDLESRAETDRSSRDRCIFFVGKKGAANMRRV